MQHIRKLVVGAIGLAAMLVHRYTGFDMGGMEPMLVDAALALLTAWGIYQVPNEA